MKNLIIVLLLAFSAITIFAQSKKEEKVSDKAKASFVKLYPNVQNVKWSKENKTNFEAEFKDNGKTTSVVIDEQGNLKETEIDISNSELPKGVEEYVAKHFNGWKITEAAKIVDAKGAVTFEAQVSKGKLNKDLIFTKEGNRLDKKQK